MKNFPERLGFCLKSKGMSKAEFARRVDVPPQNITHWIKREGISKSKLFISAQVLGVYPEWLATGAEPMLQDHSVGRDIVPSPVHNATPMVYKQTRPVPLLSWAQAGNWANAETMTPKDSEDWMHCPVHHSDKTFILRVQGTSMEPEYRDGDWIFIDPQRPAEHGTHVIVLMTDHKEATFKKLVIEGESEYLEALNPEWPDRIIKINGNATILGVVIFSGKQRVS